MKCQRKKFLLGRKEAYLNGAYMSPLLKKVENAGRNGIAGKRRPHKISGEDFFHDIEVTKDFYAQLVNCDNPERMVVVSSASYGIATVANNISIQKGENIVVTGGQFPSNIYSWMSLCEKNGAELKMVQAPNTIEHRGKKWNEDILSAIDENTKAVSIGHIHWADGTLFDLLAIRAATKKVGAAMIIDGTQSVGALPFDIQTIQPDALVCAGYKWLMGPYGIGMAYYGEMFDQGNPIEENWINRKNSDDFGNLVNYESHYREGAARYGAGEQSSFILLPMLKEAIKQLNKWKPENIQAYCETLVKEPLEQIKDLGLFVEDPKFRSAHLFGIQCPTDKLESIQRAFKKHKVSVSFRGDFVRVSPHVYNDERDMNRLVRAFQEVFK